MPKCDGTGPGGMGPMTGRGRGSGRGRGRGLGQRDNYPARGARQHTRITCVMRYGSITPGVTARISYSKTN